MNQFKTAVQQTLEPHPKKRVNYVQGLVLGVDEFTQEHLYLDSKHRLHNRLLHGYGTVAGLRLVPPQVGSPNPELLVEAGWAVDPLGREINVPGNMCVKLNDWLKSHKTELQAAGFAPGDVVPMSVVLCFHECEADDVPVPGEPCRSQNDVVQPSRIADTFELRLCPDTSAKATSPLEDCCPIAQPEEEAARAFGALLARVEITSDAVAYATADDLAAEVRLLAKIPAPALGIGPLYLRPEAAGTTLRETFRVWVTEVRPALLAAETGDACRKDDHCVLLGDLSVPTAFGWLVGGAVTVDEHRRPYLLHTRLLQEWLLCRNLGGGGELSTRTFATVYVTPAGGLRAWLHHDQLIDVPPQAVRVFLDGADSGAPQTVTAAAAGVNVLDLTLAAPVPVGTHVELRFDAALMVEQLSPPRSFVQVLDQPGFQHLDRFGNELRAYTVNLPPVPAPGGPPTGAASGDLSGTYPGPAVSGLQGRTVAATAPTTGQVLTFDGTQWAPAATAGGGSPTGAASGDLSGTYPGPAVSGLRGRTVAATVPTTGQVLTFDGTQWAPAATAAVGGPPTGPAGGDLGGTYPDPGVTKIQGTPVDPAVPQVAMGLVLEKQAAANTWVPSFVIRAVEPYSIVASGLFDGSGTPVGPVYGQLTCIPLAASTAFPSDFNLLFPGYRQPTANTAFTYIVKGTLVEPRTTAVPGLPAGIPGTVGALLPRGVFLFAAFNSATRGIQVRVLGPANRPLDPTGRFMVEISKIGG